MTAALFERPARGQRAILVSISVRGAPVDASLALAEFTELARSAGVNVVGTLSGTRHAPDAAHFIGSGKLEELRAAVQALEAQVVLFNHGLTPGQERNLEKRLQCRVVDRTGVILDIFAQRAQTYEGKLQVELAHLKHICTRLVRGWTHLERQKGGIGLRGGPGETQLEIDRRLIERRMRQIEERLERVRRQRHERRRARARAQMPTLSLVGYTNAGKSTLFNALTGADAYVANKLFATLDPTLRRLDLPASGCAVLSDTVGFIRDLPHDLVAAFRATLEEAVQSDLLLVVIDAADPQRTERAGNVEAVLEEIGAGAVPRLLVMNQIDRLPEVMPHVDRDAHGAARRVWLSAHTGAGLELLVLAIAERIRRGEKPQILQLPAHAARLRARLYDLGVVADEHDCAQGGWELTVYMEPGHLRHLCRRAGVLPPSTAESLVSVSH